MHEESSTFAHIVAIGQLQREILKNTKNQYIKESSTFANISNMNQLQMENHKKITKSQCTDVSSTIENIAAIKQAQ